MSEQPKISIIIPAFNSEKTIGKCLKSIFEQTYGDYEVIAVNDGSTDQTLQILEKCQDKVKIINQENKGAPAARNRGFGESRGEFVIFCDADVILRKDALEKMLYTLFHNPTAAYAYSSFKFGCKRFILFPFDGEKLKLVNYIHTTSLIRRKYFPGFDESLKRFQDWDLWLTMLEQGWEGIWVPEILFKVTEKGTMSTWMPKIFYKIPWDSVGWKPKAMKKYEEAKRVVEEKHNLT